jgi:hypothetical protein
MLTRHLSEPPFFFLWAVFGLVCALPAAAPPRARAAAAMEDEGVFGFPGRGWGGGNNGLAAWPSYALLPTAVYGSGAFGAALPATLPPTPQGANNGGALEAAATAPLAARWRAALGLGEEEREPSPVPPGMLRTGSSLLLPGAASFANLFEPLSAAEAQSLQVRAAARARGKRACVRARARVRRD